MQMQRLAIVILVCLLPLWGWGLYQQFSVDHEIPVAEKSQRHKPADRKINRIRLNPEIKNNSAELCQGYLFNSGRFIQSSAGSAKTVDSSSESINMETLQYDGSVIINKTRKAIISYAVADSGSRQKKKNMPSTAPHRLKVQRHSKVVAEGDTVAGYTVRVVEPLYLVFTRGDKEIKRDLFDREKQRKSGAVTKPKKVQPRKKRTSQHSKKNSVRKPVSMDML
jgi:hypothetical protein